jgi:hypothetical protein
MLLKFAVYMVDIYIALASATFADKQLKYSISICGE